MSKASPAQKTAHTRGSQKSLGRNDELVLNCLQKSSSPMSAYDILALVKQNGIKAPLQVYRALSKLSDAGLAHRLESLNAFVACAGDDHHHHSGIVAFAICTECGDVEEFADETIEERLQIWATDKDFRAEHQTIELRGTCASCA